ncbi:hypothetical protein [Aureispira anguillae]|uniref:Uncharacterized protein n=1 Tax=Aureispira anguillae TaxID=2864201 RepID=A0A915VJT3_9BACT|nr:hypothetical protein [Aureispira anguillae]BDS09342.1 hypothetical protein AsAng_0000400 [Aureispira anguillae]
MNRLMFLLLLFIVCNSCLAQKKNNKLEAEQIALRFFMDSIYPNRVILKDKILYANGKIWPTNFYTFVYIIPYYKNVLNLYNKEEDFYHKHKIIPTFNKIKGRYKPKKWGLIRKNEDCYNYPKQAPNEHKKPRFPPSGFLNVYSMSYDSTHTEKLVAIEIIINGFSQAYQWASYAFVIKDKKIIYWREKEDLTPKRNKCFKSGTSNLD